MREISVESKTPGFSLTRYSNLLVVVAGLLSAGLLYFGTGLHPIILHANWRLVRVALCRGLRRSARISAPYAIANRIEKSIHQLSARELRSGGARGNEIFRFVESKPLPQLVPKQKEIDAHLKNDGANRKIPDFPDLKAWHP